MTFKPTPIRLSVAGLFGCTAVGIVPTMGLWCSHHWEGPSFQSDDAEFEREVLDTIKDGDPDHSTRISSPFPLFVGNSILVPTWRTGFHLNAEDYGRWIGPLWEKNWPYIDLLTGEGMPWAEITPTSGKEDYRPSSRVNNAKTGADQAKHGANFCFHSQALLYRSSSFYPCFFKPPHRRILSDARHFFFSHHERTFIHHQRYF